MHETRPVYGPSADLQTRDARLQKQLTALKAEREPGRDGRPPPVSLREPFRRSEAWSTKP
jgi:hypothetical protein